jgi:hypothetical protein
MSHRNNIAGSSLRRNRKRFVNFEKSGGKPRISRRISVMVTCCLFVRRSNIFWATRPIPLQIHHVTRIHETITALQQDLRVSRAGRCGSNATLIRAG